MKRYLPTILRLLLASAGIAYIVWSLTWADHVLIPPDTLLPDDRTFPHEVQARVLEGDQHTPPGQSLTIQLPEEHAADIALALPANLLHHHGGPVRYQPGVPTTLARANPGLLLLGLALVALIPLFQAWRWLLLMRSQQLDPGYRKALRLTMVGLFFNFCFPGMTGGDLVKAYYAAAGSGQGRRGPAVMSVIFDRIAGMIGLVLLAALVSLLVINHPRIGPLVPFIWLGLLLIVVGSVAYFSTRLRRRLGLNQWIARFRQNNLLVRIDQVAMAYREKHRTVYAAVLLSLPPHLGQMLAAAIAGWTLGMSTPAIAMLTALPLVFLAGALPISYQGLGVMEALAFALLRDPDLASTNQIVGMLLVARIYLLFYAALGAFFVLRGHMHLFPQDLENDQTAPNSTNGKDSPTEAASLQ